MPKIVTVNIGDRFWKWSIIGAAEMLLARSGKTERRWLCRCECGTERVIQQSKLRSGQSKGCGCKDDILGPEVIGKRFGRLIVQAEAEPYIHGGKRKRRWLCRCDCGGQTITTVHKLQSGHTSSCGCLQQENRTKHGRHGSTTYRIWDAMVQRCHNENNHKFYMYGARGITVCDRWRAFENFLADMGERPKDRTIDRIDNDKGYEPGNCRWATRKEQQRNMRRNHVVQYMGREMSVAEAAEIAGVSANPLYPLLNHKGFSIEEAIKHVGG